MDMAKDLFYAQQALVALFSVTNKLQMRGDQQLENITLRQMLAIPALVHAPDGRASINHLARSMGTSKQSARQIVDAMARKGYLSVAPSPQDRRAVHVTVTPQGQQAFRVCSQRTDVFLADVFRHVSAEELENLCTLLQKLYRFDGAAQEPPAGQTEYDAAASNEMLRHHPRFAEKRADTSGREAD